MAWRGQRGIVPGGESAGRRNSRWSRVAHQEVFLGRMSVGDALPSGWRTRTARPRCRGGDLVWSVGHVVRCGRGERRGVLPWCGAANAEFRVGWGCGWMRAFVCSDRGERWARRQGESGSYRCQVDGVSCALPALRRAAQGVLPHQRRRASADAAAQARRFCDSLAGEAALGDGLLMCSEVGRRVRGGGGRGVWGDTGCPRTFQQGRPAPGHRRIGGQSWLIARPRQGAA